MSLPSQKGAPARRSSASRPSARARNIAVGVDVGGTFTDIMAFDDVTGTIRVRKVPTSKNVSLSISKGLKGLSVAPADISLFTHATTLVTNALLTHYGLARTALVTNEGFRDILEIGRQRRPEVYNLKTQRPATLVERRHRFTVECRIGGDGSALQPLNPATARSLARQVVREKFDSIAVSFLNSYLNPTHEQEMLAVLRREGYHGHVSLSSEVDPEYREYERTSTTVVNAVLAPMTDGYLSRLARSLWRMGVRAPFYVMTSDGGMSTSAAASRLPVMTIESGPAAGALAAGRLSERLSLKKALSFDMGGTTAKACTIIDGKPDMTREFEVAGRTHSGRSIRGSGYAVRGPFIDVAEVSAGGGTVAWLDEAGQLQVGPRSAGSEPGPACYGRGGKEPTVTDANVITGRLNPKHLLGGDMPIYEDRAADSLRTLASEDSGVIELARGVIRLVNDAMARAISIVSVERGRDPRDFTMIAFGGAGPVHACDLADAMGIEAIVVPIHAGLFSAYGLIVGDITRSFSAPVPGSSSSLKRQFQRLEAVARSEMERDGFMRFKTERYLEARYLGQSHELLLPYTRDSDVESSFGARHKALYGYRSPDPVQVVNIGVRSRVAGPKKAALKQERTRRQGESSTRSVWVGGETRLVEVLTREEMRPGKRGSGPCVIEEYDSTLVVNPGWEWRAEEFGMRLWKR